MTVAAASNRAPSPKRSASSKQTKSDNYYGHEETAKMCARFITALFSCPDVPPPPPSGATPTGPSPTLAAFIAYALHRTRLSSSVTYCALFLLSRLKGRFPAARGSSGHRLFISAFMIASKVICDDTYSNKSWCVVGQGMFSLREINQMEREMCSYLEWILNVKPEELAEFEADVKKDYGTGGVKVGIATSPATTTAEASPVATAPRAVVTVATTVAAPIAPPAARAVATSLNPYPSPESSPPTPSHSDSSSPASSEPRTPPSQEDDDPAARNPIQGGRVSSKGGAPISSSQKVPSTVHAVQVKVVEERLPRSQSFAYASPAEW
ncbi:hypothetical protein FRB93_005594 [Tulasnella sp. JGI-2019a]|nr:hypothetical protein FRB93_005594 [Tulasnella sp. JGI-2019a]